MSSRHYFRSATGKPLDPRIPMLMDEAYKGYLVHKGGVNYDPNKDVYFGEVIIKGKLVEFIVDFEEDLQFAFEATVDLELGVEVKLPPGIWSPPWTPGLGAILLDAELSTNPNIHRSKG